MHEIDSSTMLEVKLTELTKKIKELSLNQKLVEKNANINDLDIIYARKQKDNFGNSYNPNWRNHPNLSWRNNNFQGVENINDKNISYEALIE